jgi:diaminohydroxyphosphoribosylaminopyrimidine deaminase/5-amino-6-(5-phosphoribosylamino)uracil reductase
MMPPSVYMRKALEAAEENRGQTWPNPCVGCVIVQGETIVGIGVTQKGGRPHAEDMALAQAGTHAQGATVYVTLEPCAHKCVFQLIKAGVGSVVAAIEDPDPRTAGQGLEQLRRAGIRVTLGDGGAEGLEAHRGFFSRLHRQRPVVDVKMGMSLDGRVALADGRSQWITGEVARAHVQVLRSRYDALLTSCKTIVADRARLTCRLSGREQSQPLRILMGNAARLTPDLPVFQDGGPVWLISWHDVPDSLKRYFQNIIIMKHEDTLKKVFLNLGKEGLTQVMVESGPQLITSLFQEDLVDRWHLFYAPVLLGGDAKPMLQDLLTTELQQNRLRILETQNMGDDFYIHVENKGHRITAHTNNA